MVMAYDQWAQMPVKDLYDSQIMAMSIAAAKDMYEKGQKRLEDFNAKYGDFMSPIQKDMDWYNQNVTGKVRDTINNLYANGIDPLRSAEGRAAISQLIYSMPTGDISKVRQSAEAAKEYIKNRGILEAKGLYNPDAEQNYLGFDLNNYSTLGYTTPEGEQVAGRGVWGRTSPIENQTMDQIIEPIIKNLDYSYDEARTKQANDGNDYYTVSEDRIRATIADAMKDLTVNGTMGGYYYNQALQATGGDPDKARALYTEWLVNRGKDHLKEKFTPNKWKEMAQEHKYRMAEKAYAASLRGGKSGTGSNNDEIEGWTDRRRIASFIQREMNAGTIQSFSDWKKKIDAVGKKKGGGSITTAETGTSGGNMLADYYKSSQHVIKPGDDAMAKELFSFGFGTTKYSNKNAGTSTQKGKVSFVDDDLRPTNIAQAAWAGYNLNKKGISSKFAEYLKSHSIEGDVVGRPTVNHNYSKDKDMHILEINRNVRISRDEFKGFAGDKTVEYAKRLGLKGVGLPSADGTYAFYDVPSSRRVEFTGDDKPIVDTYSDALTFGKSVAAKREPIYLDEED